MNVIFLCQNDQRNTAVEDHIRSFKKYSRHNIYYFNPIYDLPDFKILDFFDVMIIHYTVWHKAYISAMLMEFINQYSGYKVLFRQDEYRLVNKSTNYINSIFKVDLLVSSLNPEAVERVYPRGSLNVDRIVTQLPGYVDDERLEKYMAEPIRTDRRPIDIGYRGRRRWPCIGEVSLNKAKIGEVFSLHLGHFRPEFKFDIAVREEDRLYGRRWNSFLQNCQAMLGIESGSTLYDPEGKLEDLYLRNIGLINCYEDFVELVDKRLGGISQFEVDNLKIPPKVFGYMLHQNVMILLEGRYSGVIKPDEHYIPVNNSYSNLEEVLEKFESKSYTRSLLANVKKLLRERIDLRYSTVTREFDTLLEKRLSKKQVIVSGSKSLKIKIWFWKKYDRVVRIIAWLRKKYYMALRVKNRWFYFLIKLKARLLDGKEL